MTDTTLTDEPDEARESEHESNEEPQPELVHGVPVTRPRGETVLHPSREEYVGVVEALLADGYLMCIDLTAVDYLDHPGRTDLPEGLEPHRFELVTQFINHAERSRVRLRVQVPEAEPVVASLFSLHPGTEALERETYDMFGIVFEGHPDPTRILMPEDWDGHPLRRDYAQGRIPVQFKGAPATR
ncbi:MAG: NADH-quinone oxidoreductase subunit C [Acidimicrobiales bacterium]